MEKIGDAASSEGITMTTVDALQLFVGGDVAAVEVVVETGEAADGEGDGEEEDSDDEGDGIGFESLTESFSSAITVDTGAQRYFYNTKTKGEDGVGEEAVDEDKKVAVVADADAVAHPRAVVVVVGHAVVAHRAVGGAGRPPDVAGLAVLAGDAAVADLVGQRLGVLAVGVDGRAARQDARVDEASDEQRDDRGEQQRPRNGGDGRR